MRNYYYIIWVELIISFKKHHPNDNDWKKKLTAYMSVLNAINVWLIVSWLQFFGVVDATKYNLNIFLSNIANNVLTYFLLFILPFHVINRLLIFYKDRYLILIEKYTLQGNKNISFYAYSTIILGFLSSVIQIYFNL